MPPALVMNAALPPVLSPKKLVTPPALVVIIALPAVLPWKKPVVPLLVMVALPAVAVPPVQPQPEKMGEKSISPPVVDSNGRVISGGCVVEKNEPAVRAAVSVAWPALLES